MNIQDDLRDLFRELKKEVGELKKEVAASKTKTNTHLSDEDFFGLDEDYNSADYSLNAAAATPAAASGFYQNYQGRASTGPIPGYPPVYYPGMPPIYPYGLALPQAAGKDYLVHQLIIILLMNLWANCELILGVGVYLFCCSAR